MKFVPRSILVRWLDVVCLIFTSCVISLIAEFSWNTPSNYWLQVSEHIPFWLQTCLFYCLSVVIFSRLGQRRGELSSKWIWVKYPPSWLAAVATLAATAIWLPYKAHDWLCASLIVAAGWISAKASSWIRRDPKHEQFKSVDDTTRRLEDPTTKLDETTVLKWLEQEEPVNNATFDFFDSSAVAARVADRINVSRRVALLGQYGSGKSSVITLVKQLLPQNIYWTTTVDGWGHKPADAAEAILRSIVSELSLHIDVVKLVGLPSRYRAAMTGSKSAPAAILNELTSISPTDVLTKLDNVLSAVNRRFVIFIEDLDRQANPETIASVAALLDRLRKLRCLCFVVAIDATRTESFDIIRLCEYSEMVLPIEITKSHKLLDIVVRICAQSHNIYFPNSDRLLGWRAPDDEPKSRFERIFGGRSIDQTAEAMLRTSRTPRVIKSVFRQSLAAWNELHGEVDLPELFVVECLRIVSPSSWQLLGDEVEQFRQTSNGWKSSTEEAKKERQDRRDVLKNRLEDAIGKDRANLADVHRLVAFLFPGWTREPIVVEPEGQFVRYDNPTDYWRRMVRRSVQEPIHDQAIFAAISAFQTEKSNALPKMLVNSAHVGRTVERFGKLLDQHDVLPLTALVHAEMLARDHSRASVERTESAISLWRMSSRYRLRGRCRFLLDQVELALPVSLALALDIAYYWSSEHANYGLNRSRVYRATRLIAKAKFLKLEDIVHALPPAGEPHTAYLLNHLIVAGQLKVREADSAIADQWQWFIDLLLNAQQFPFRLLVQILALLSHDVEKSFHVRERHVADELVVKLIPDSVKRRLLFDSILRSTEGLPAASKQQLVPFEVVIAEMRPG